MTTTDELDDRLHIVEQDVRLLRGDMIAVRRQMDTRFTRLQENIDRKFGAMDQRFEAIDQRFDALQRDINDKFHRAGAQMERIIEMIRGLGPR